MPDKTGKAPTARDLIHRQGLMDDTMARFSVDPLALIGKDGGQSYVEARSRCRGCGSVGTCRDWLLTGDGAASSEPQDFCLNSGLFRILLGK
ncbi:MAG: DUF6455 family protein [Methyloceanibacter sp.]